VDAMRGANETSGLQGGVKIMAMPRPYKKDNALCSPTSAFGKETNAEPPGQGTEDSSLTDSDKYKVETIDAKPRSPN